MDTELRTILLAEDDEFIREGITDLLEMEGYKVNKCKNGLEAFESLKINKPDLVISDILMPVMDGYSLLEEYRKLEGFIPVPFIFLSALSDQSDLRMGMGIGADDYLTKPFSRADLINTIQFQYKKFQQRKNYDTVNHKLELEKISKKTKQEIEVLLAEVHHRVKHNFTLLSAFVELEGNSNKEEFINSIKSKIFAMASVHDEAYSNGVFTNINIYKLIYNIINKNIDNNSFNNEIETDININNFELDIAKAIPFGILFYELINHIFSKFFSSDNGSLSIECNTLKDSNELLIICKKKAEKNKNIDCDIHEMDVEIINVLVQQLEGEINIDLKSNEYLTCFIKF